MSSSAAGFIRTFLLCLLLPGATWAQAPADHAAGARRFLAGRTAANGRTAAALAAARSEHLALVDGARAARPRTASPRLNPLSAAWAAVGPAQITSLNYGMVTGRVTSIAVDPADASGNTVYVGTTGGGVWKSTNAAGMAASVSFAPLTDTLPVFSANAGTAAIPSLSIGAVSVGNGVVLAGTGDPNDALDSYYGEGILRSTDGGVTWTLIQESHDGVAGNHMFTGLGVAGFAWSTTSPGLVVAAFSQSAEGVLVNAPDKTNSVMGLYYSTDSGATWQMGTLEDGGLVFEKPLPAGASLGGNAVTAVVWNPLRGRFYAAVRYHGYYESTDGMTWSRVAHQPGAGLSTTACPANPNTPGSTGCPIFRGALAVQTVTGDTFALTVDGNNLDQGLWQDVCGGNGGPCAANPIVFGTRLSSSALEMGGGNSAIAQADYNLVLAAVPTGAGASADTLLFAGTEDLYRCSLAAGCTLRNTTNALNGCAAPAKVAPAQHGLAAVAGAAAPLLYIGNDGGLWRSPDGVNQQSTPCSPDDATHFENLNGALGSLAEVVSFAQHPTDPGILLAAVGANGTAASPGSGGSTAWPQLAAGEGGSVAINPVDPVNWYVSTAAGVSVRWCAKGTSCTALDFVGAPTLGYAQVAQDASVIAPPVLLDPGLSSDVLIGTCRVWRGLADDAGGWPGSNAISPMLSGPQNTACTAGSNGMVRSLAAGGAASGAASAQQAGSTVLYAGMAGRLDGGNTAGGHLFANVAADTGTTWTDVALSSVSNDAVDAGVFNPGGFDVSSVAADPHDATGRTVYATVMGFAGNGVNAPHVYRSTDAGGHWVNITSNLPNAPANALVVDPNDANTIYVAMDTGVYVTTAVTTCGSANCWSVYGTILPNAPVVALQAEATLATGDGRYGVLRAGTYGRGIWTIPLLNTVAGVAPVMALTPSSLTFTSQPVSTASAGQTVTVANTGSATLTISQVAVTGDFAETTTCGSATLAPGGSCSVSVEFLPTATGARSGVLTVFGNVAGGQATVALIGTGTPAAAIVLNPVLATFASTDVGSASAPVNITVSNTGGTAATLGAAAVTGDFAITANTCGATLGAGVGCTVAIAFLPTSSGGRTGMLSISSGAGTQTASLSGTGVLSATDGLSPLALSFAPQQLNTASASQSVTLTNTGDAALQLVAARITSGDFTVVNGCGNSLNGHASCAMQVAFVPKSVGAKSGVLTVSDEYRSQTVALTGTGLAPPGVSLSPVSGAAFGATGVGSSSAAQTVTLTNNGGLPLTLQNVTLTGDFAISPGTDTCGAVLAVGTACTLQIVFTPVSGGIRSGTVTVTDNAAGSPQTLALTGTGVDFTLSPDGSTTATISAGQQAVFPLLLSSAAGVPGTVALSCAPVPAHATCTVTPASPALGGTTVVEVTIATSVLGATLTAPPVQARDSRNTAWLAALLPLGMLALRRRSLPLPALLGCVLFFGCVAGGLSGCSASRVIPDTTTGGGGGGTGSNPTPAGTYSVTVSGTSAGLTRSVMLTLVVQ